MTVLLFVVFTFLISSGHSQECQDVPNNVNFYILPDSSFCVNCPFLNASWTINTFPLENAFPNASDYTVFPNNSLLVRTSVEGTYQCADAFPDIHRFTVSIATDSPPFINDPTVYNETDNVQLTCMNNAIPTPITTMWQRNDETVSTNPILTINSIQRSDAGVYTCCIERIVAGGLVPTCNDFMLTVQYGPTIPSLSPGNDAAPEGTHHIIECTFNGLPTPTVTWSYNNSTLTNGSDDITIATDDSSSTLTIITLTEDDSGVYTCMVFNLLGSSTATSVLQVQVPPDPPSNVMVIDSTTMQLRLSWTNSFDGHSPITMVMIAYEVAGSNVTVQANTMTSHTITGLMPNMEYRIFLESFNIVGGSGSVSVTGMTDPLPPGAPTVDVTASSSTALTVSWTVTVQSSMTAVTNWTVHYGITDSNDVTITSYNADDNGDELTGLEKGTSYTILVAASNSAGSGQFTTRTISTLIDPPSEPTNLTAVALSHSRVRVMWGPVTDNGGAQVNQYKLVVTGPAGLSSPEPRDFPPEDNEYIVTGLKNKTSYLIQLSASNSQGFGPNATATVVTLDIGVPTPPTLMESETDRSDLSITVTWNQPVDIEIDHYRIEYTVKVGEPDWKMVIVNAPATRHVITGLAPMTTYTVRIFAISIDGVSSVAADAITITTEAQPSVKIEGETVIAIGGRLELTCLLDDGRVPYNPQWQKNSGNLSAHVIVEGTNGHVLVITSVNLTDAGLYTCTNQINSGGAATVNVNITNSGAMAQSEDNALDTTEYILIGIGGAILLGILILIICIICVCCVRYRRRPKIYSPSKGSNWIDGDGHTGIVFMASSYSTSQSPSQREDTTDAPYLMGCKEDEFHNTSTFNTLERSAIHSYHQDSYNQPQDSNGTTTTTTTDKSHRAHYAELDLAPSSKFVPASSNSVQYAQVDKSSFKRNKNSLSPPHTKSVPVPVETPTAAAAKKHYDNPTYEMSSSYHYPVTPGDTVV